MKRIATAAPMGMLRYDAGKVVARNGDPKAMFHDGWSIPLLPASFSGDVPFMAIATPHRLSLMASLPSSVRRARSTNLATNELPYIALWASVHAALRAARNLLGDVKTPDTVVGTWDLTLELALEVSPDSIFGWAKAADVALAASAKKLARPISGNAARTGVRTSAEAAYPLIQEILRDREVGQLAHENGRRLKAQVSASC